MRDIQSIKNIMEIYEKASRQKLNTEKTTLFLRKNVPDCSKMSIKNLLGVREIREYESHLGLLVVVGRNKRVSLNYIKDRVWASCRDGRRNCCQRRGKKFC